ncbi:MAG TPA: hypothetical protein VFL99_11385 [Segeticoccus sp.]|uniref:hypothetical protein n=1 Tax=Segeticoccus sp. TaxID=2706531 RepID=UPI002D80956F|nr:hypothetical protein [Segeticoccus sp.]HET8600920.1 hypothetical protein [Segeticoccus sp.]
MSDAALTPPPSPEDESRSEQPAAPDPSGGSGDGSEVTTSTPGGRTFPDIRGQSGFATRRQLEAGGWSRSAIRHRLGERWHLVYPRVVAPHTRQVSGRERAIAAQLWAGHHAVLTGLAGLYVLGLDDDRTVRELHFLAPQAVHQRRHADALVHRTDRPLHAYRREGCLQVMHAARCLVDAARWDVRERDERIALTTAVLQQGLTKPLRVHHELRHTHRNDTVDVRDAVRAFERGAWSRPEAVLAEALGRSTVLPEVLLNAGLALPNGQRLPTPDAYVQEVALAIQVHSRKYHARNRDWQGTVEADLELTRHGIVVQQVTPRTLDEGAAGFVRAVEQSYQQLLGRPLPDIVVTPRTS